MRTSFLRTHLDILDSSAYVEVHLNISPSAVHIHPHVLIKNIVRSLKVRTCTNVTPVTHLQTQTSKFEIYSADNWLFRHCQSKGRLKHLPAHISCSRICNFLPSDTKPEMQFAQQPAPRWIYFKFLAGFVETFLHDLQIHVQQPAQMIFFLSRLLFSTIGDLQN